MINMIKNIKYLFLLLIISATFVSCLSDKDTITDVNNDAALASFYLQSVKTWNHTISSTGGDSVYSVMKSATNYKFDIDHINGIVFNRDSLPKNHDASQVLCNASAYQNGIVAYRIEQYDTIYAFNSTDTIDFTNPVEFRVYPADGSGVYRKYVVSLNVHKEVGDSVQWTFMANVPDLACEKIKTFCLENKLYAFCSNGAVTNVFVSGNGVSWDRVNPSINLNSETYSNIVAYNGELYALTDGNVYRSADAINWNFVSTASLDKLIAAGTLEMYGLKDGWIMFSNDGGLTWQRDNVDAEDTVFLPSQNFSYTIKPVASNSYTEKVIIVGNRSLEKYPDDNYAMIWQKTIEKRADSKSYNWMRSVYAPSAEYQLKKTGNAAVVLYDNQLLAYQPDGFYSSNDEGLIWNKNSIYTVPTEFAETPDNMSIAVDSNNILWIIGNTGNVWRARLNRLAWK